MWVEQRQQHFKFQVQVGFFITPSMLDNLKSLANVYGATAEGVELQVLGYERKLHFRHDLVIGFCGRFMQVSKIVQF